jgi:3-oxoadipate enol-lactonase
MRFLFQQTTIHYEVYGTGQPVVFLNGIMMSSKSWLPLLPSLTDHFQVILVDLLDQGESDSQSYYTISDQGDLIIELLNALHINQCALVGISYGGEVALDVSIKQPTRISHLIVMNSTLYTDHTLYQLGLKWMELCETYQGQAFYEHSIPLIYGKKFKESHRQWLEKRSKNLEIVFNSKQFLDRMYRLTSSSQHTDYREHAALIQSKTLIVSGEDDILIPIHYQKVMHQHIKNSTHVILPNVGHATMYEAPRLFNSLVIGWILDHSTHHDIEEVNQ